MEFKDDLITGKIGEQAFWDYCQNEPWVRSVIDLRKDKRSQANDIDFMVETTERQFHTFEVKADTQMARTGNIFFETKSCGNIGCLARSKADFIAYFCIDSRVFFIMNTDKVRKLINDKGLKPIKATNANTEGYLISLYDLTKEKIAKRVSLNEQVSQ